MISTSKYLLYYHRMLIIPIDMHIGAVSMGDGHEGSNHETGGGVAEGRSDAKLTTATQAERVQAARRGHVRQRVSPEIQTVS